MQPLIFIAVGYITGILWGLYLKISIVPIIFLLFLLLIFFRKRLNYMCKNKLCFWGLIISIVVSNVQVNYLSNKFDTLYYGLDEIDLVGIIVSNAKHTDYKTTYKIKIESINGDTKYRNTYLNLYCKNEKLDYGKKVSFNRYI